MSLTSYQAAPPRDPVDVAHHNGVSPTAQALYFQDEASGRKSVFAHPNAEPGTFKKKICAQARL
jgi:hypothetical protein